MFISATHLISWPNFSITDELLTSYWSNIGAQGYLTSGVRSRGSISLVARCNAKTYSMFISATHLILRPNFSITDELLTLLWCKVDAQGYLTSGVTSGGSMTLAKRCNAHNCSISFTTTHPMSCPYFSITDEVLTYFWV